MKRKLLLFEDGKLIDIKVIVDDDEVTITNAVSGYIKIKIKALQEIAEEIKKGR